MIVYIGADHGGFKLKSELIKYLRELGHEPVDIGAKELNKSDDYSDIGHALKAKADQQPDKTDFRAIMICSSGVGMCISANKIFGLRAALCQNPETAYFARLHNDINVLCLAGLRSNTDSIEKVTEGEYSDLIDAGMNTANMNEAKRIAKVFLETETEATEGSRHRRRLDKIIHLEETCTAH